MKSWHWKQIAEKLKCDTRIFVGLDDSELPKYVHEGRDFLYMDNAYFRRGPRSTNFRLIRRGFHLTKLLDRPADRLEGWNILHKMQPWRKNGRSVIVIPPSAWYERIFGGGWLLNTLPYLQTDRPVIVKHDKKEPLAPMLEDAWCLVTYGSVAGIEAALSGVPVFSGPLCPTLPISAGGLGDIEKPVYADREPWLRSLSYATWRLEEIEQINLKDYDYR